MKDLLIFKIIENPTLCDLNALSHDLIDQLKDYGLKLAGVMIKATKYIAAYVD